MWHSTSPTSRLDPLVSGTGIEHPEIVDIGATPQSLSPTVLALQNPPTTDSFDDKRSLQFDEATNNGAYRSDFSKSKMDAAATTGPSQLVAHQNPANSFEETVSKLQEIKKLKDAAEKLKSKKRPGFASKKTSTGTAQNSPYLESPESTQTLFGVALKKAANIGFSVLKSTGLTFDLGTAPERDIASFDAMAADTSSDRDSDEATGLLELFILLAGALAVAAGYYALIKRKQTK